MITAFKLAGFFAAHAIWSVSEGGNLVPMFAYTTEEGDKKMQRLLIGEDVGKSVAFGQETLDANELDATDAVLVYDGRILVNDRKVDAVIIEIRCYFSLGSKAVMAVPYELSAPGKSRIFKPKAQPAFRVFKPKLQQWEQCEDFDVNMAVQSFFEGVDSHEKGAAIWNNSLDQSM